MSPNDNHRHNQSMKGLVFSPNSPALFHLHEMDVKLSFMDQNPLKSIVIHRNLHIFNMPQNAITRDHIIQNIDFHTVQLWCRCCLLSQKGHRTENKDFSHFFGTHCP